MEFGTAWLSYTYMYSSFLARMKECTFKINSCVLVFAAVHQHHYWSFRNAKIVFQSLWRNYSPFLESVSAVCRNIHFNATYRDCFPEFMYFLSFEIGMRISVIGTLLLGQGIPIISHTVGYNYRHKNWWWCNEVSIHVDTHSHRGGINPSVPHFSSWWVLTHSHTWW
jgi:hypothetical protein